MSAEDDVVALERAGWAALASSGAEAMAFYREVLDDSAVMLLPGGLVLDDREGIIAAMGGEPWSSFALQDVAVLRPLPDTALVHYGVHATRAGRQYSALVGSLYVRRDGGWRMAAHQQTPR